MVGPQRERCHIQLDHFKVFYEGRKRNGSALKSAYYSCRGCGFDSQHPQGELQLL